MRNWLKSEVSLFIEYLNKVENITYSDMSRRTGIAISLISTLELSYKNSVVIFVKYRDYIKRFERYYDDKVN